MNTKLVLYWTITILLASELLVGGMWDLTHYHYVLAIVTRLGYPAYVLSILGFWKVLAGVAILVPRLPMLKEWAYAGVFFEMTGALASHVAHGDSAVNLIAPAIFAAITVASRALRPADRRSAAIAHA